MEKKHYSLADLELLMNRLRDPESGCPWDVEQTFNSIAPCALEEACEVVEAIEQKDFNGLEEELGDLLLQVVFHSCMARERGIFSLNSVIDRLVKKLIRRHPHVFPDGTLSSRRQGSISAEEAYQIWQTVKQQEKKENKPATNAGPDNKFDMPSPGLPALKIAEQLQKKATKHKFDWPEVEPVFAKIREEINEVELAISQGKSEEITSEVGDLLFSCVNLARHLKVDPELALRKSNLSFYKRVSFILERIAQANKKTEDCSPDELEIMWQQAKLSLR